MKNFSFAIALLLLLSLFVSPGYSQGGSGDSCSVENLAIECGSAVNNADYTVTFNVINNTSFVVHKLFIPGDVGGLGISPNIIDLIPPILVGDIATDVEIYLTGGSPGAGICLPLGLISKDDMGDEFECCGTEFCVELPICEVLFIRGDSNRDGGCDIGDAINMLTFLFGGGVCSCMDACDCNDDGQVNIADAICKLSYLFSGGPPPSSPHPECGPDPTPDSLDCASFPPCP
jgi:hypothetical protein